MVDEYYDPNTGQGGYIVDNQSTDAVTSFGVENNLLTTVFRDTNSIRLDWDGARVRRDHWHGNNESAFSFRFFESFSAETTTIVANEAYGRFTEVFGAGAQLGAFYWHAIDYLGPEIGSTDPIYAGEDAGEFLFPATGENSAFASFSGESVLTAPGVQTNIVPAPVPLPAAFWLMVGALTILRPRARDSIRGLIQGYVRTLLERRQSYLTH